MDSSRPDATSPHFIFLKSDCPELHGAATKVEVPAYLDARWTYSSPPCSTVLSWESCESLLTA